MEAPRPQSEARTPQPVEDRRIVVVGQDVLAETEVRDLPAEVAAGGAAVVGERVQQIAVGTEIPIRIGPRPRHAGHAERRGAGQPEAGIRARPGSPKCRRPRDTSPGWP